MMRPLKIAVFSYFLPEFGLPLQTIRSKPRSGTRIRRRPPATLAEQFDASNRPSKHITSDHRVAGSSPAGCKAKRMGHSTRFLIESPLGIILPIEPGSLGEGSLRS